MAESSSSSNNGSSSTNNGSSSSDDSSSMYKLSVKLENINQYSLHFSSLAIATSRAIVNLADSSSEEVYKTHFEDIVNERNEEIQRTNTGVPNFFKSYSEIINDDVTSENLLRINGHLITEETISSLTKLALDEEGLGEYSPMENIVRQAMLMKHILKLINTTFHDTNRCIEVFFHRLRSSSLYRQQFHEDVGKCQNYIKDHAIEIECAINKEDQEKERLDHGNLDPKMVMESLPEELKQYFQTRDLTKFQMALFKMSKKDADDCLDRCLRLGLLIAKPKEVKE